jgi:serine phosphatase RsbU (regulator of sigma subunit)
LKKIIIILLFSFSGILSYSQKADSLKKIVYSKAVDSVRIKALIYLAEAIRREDVSSAIVYSKNASRWCDSVNADPKFKALAEMGLATALEWSGALDTAIHHFNIALDYFKKSGNKYNVASCKNGLGNCYSQLGDYAKALVYYFDALAIATDIDDKHKQAVVLGNIASTYGNMDDGTNSLKYEKQGIDLRLSIGDSAGVISSLNNLAGLYLDIEQLPEVEATMKKEWAILQRFGDTNDSAFYFSLLGKVYGEKKDYPNALKYLQMGLTLDTLIGEQSSATTNRMEIGLMYLAMRDTAKANPYLERGFRELREMNVLPLIEDAYEAVADQYASTGMSLEAYKLLKKLLILQDTLHSSELNDLIAKKEAGYQNERKQHELDNLKKNATIDALQLSHTKYLVGMLIVCVILVLIGLAFLFNRNRSKQLVNEQLEKHNAEITSQKKSITDSINYAKKIQDSILPPESQIKRVLPNSFILYEPKDVVSGDFYWLDSRDNFSIFAAVDCTGHGVPGALMSVIGFNLLNQAVNEMGLTKPSDILHHLDYGVNKLLRQSDGGNSVKDGMDIALCSYDSTTRKLQYAGVFNPAYLVTKGEFTQLKPDKFPIGINVDGVTDLYTNQEIQLYPGDMIYLFSDGYADQFGGPMGKKYKYTRFRELLLKIHGSDCGEQKNLLRREYLDWKGNLEQVDDILVIGLRVE